MAITKNFAKRTSIPYETPIDDQELARLSTCMEATLAEIETLDAQGLLSGGYVAMGETIPASIGRYEVKVTFSRL